MTWPILLAAPFIGLLLSLFAAGGGMIAVPLLSYGTGMPFKQAIATSLVIVAFISLISLLQHKRWKLIDRRLHRFFAVSGMAGGWLGASIGLRMSDQIQSMLFATLLLLVAWWLLSHPMKNIHARAQQTPCNCPLAMLAGAGSGLLAGLLGVGGGFIIVPLLLMLGVKSYQSAIAHSLLMIITNSMVAVIGYGLNLDMAWRPVLIITLLAAFGSWLGSLIAAKHSSERLQKSFSLILCIVSAWMLYKAFFSI